MALADVMVALVLALSLAAALLQALAQRAHVRARVPEPDELPAVSILKPLKGVDADLRENLRSLFRLDYPTFEVILGAEAPDDAALAVARQVASEFPAVRSLLLCGSTGVGLNPKVNNLARLALPARHPLLLISDSNVRVSAPHLRRLVAHRARAGGGLVSSLVRGVAGGGLGGVLESLQLNGPVMGGVSAVSRFLEIPCAVGKSMLLHRADLERIGGFPFLGQFLAEDQICAEELARRGVPVQVSGDTVDNVLGHRTLRDFAGRHLRWARLRRRVNAGGYAGEVLLNPVFLALFGLAAFPSGPTLIAAGATLAAVSALDATTERLLGLRRPLWSYPVLELALGLIRGVLWFVPLVSRTVVWRGNVLTLGARSRIERSEPAAPRGASLLERLEGGRREHTPGGARRWQLAALVRR